MLYDRFSRKINGLIKKYKQLVDSVYCFTALSSDQQWLMVTFFDNEESRVKTNIINIANFNEPITNIEHIPLSVLTEFCMQARMVQDWVDGRYKQFPLKSLDIAALKQRINNSNSASATTATEYEYVDLSEDELDVVQAQSRKAGKRKAKKKSKPKSA
jgi:hypothetical protein